MEMQEKVLSILNKFSNFSSGTKKISGGKEKPSVNSYYDHVDLTTSEGLSTAGFQVKQNAVWLRLL